MLQEAQVHLIDAGVCNSSGWYKGAIHTHNICAGYPQGGIDTCQVGACYKPSPGSTGSPATTAQTCTVTGFSWPLTLPLLCPTAEGLTPLPLLHAFAQGLPALSQRPGTMSTKPTQCPWQPRASPSQTCNILLQHLQDKCAAGRASPA